MFCSSCGAQLAAGANFCSACGAKLAQPDAAAPPAPRAPSPAKAQASSPAKVLDAGDKLLLSGSQPADVEAALNQYLKQGAKLITPLCQVGNMWAAACTIPPKTKSLEDTQTLNLAEVKAAVAKAEEPEDGCRVEELGFKRIVYGPTQLAVKLRLEHMKQFGAEVIGEIEEVEGEWVVVCDVGSAKNTGYKW